MNHPPPPPKSTYFEMFDGRRYFVLRVGGCEHLFNLSDAKRVPDEIRPIIAAVAAEEWRQTAEKLLKNNWYLYKPAKDAIDDWREWGKK